MARNTLEAVFGALGAGLTGFGRERQQRQEDEQRRRREADLMRVQMLNMGFDPEGEATRRSQGLAQAGRIAQAAPATPFMPATSALGQALSQASQDLPRGRSITVGGERFVQPLSRMPETMAQRQVEQAEARDIRAEGRALERFRAEQQIRTEGTTKEIRERATAAGRSAGLSPNDRAYQATLQFARTPIETELGLPSRLPTDEEVQQFAARAKAAESAVYGKTPTGGEASGTTAAPAALSKAEWAAQNPARRGESFADYQARYNAYARGAR